MRLSAAAVQALTASTALTTDRYHHHSLPSPMEFSPLSSSFYWCQYGATFQCERLNLAEEAWGSTRSVGEKERKGERCDFLFVVVVANLAAFAEVAKMERGHLAIKDEMCKSSFCITTF